MPDEHKTVFISYRRSAAAFIARSIFLDLRAHGYDVFMDVESIDSGTFDTIILNQIEARAHFLIILTPGTLERCVEAGDWLRREIEQAMDLRRNIVPLIVGKFTFEGTEAYLTGKLADLPRYNGVEVPHTYFDAAMERLRTRFLKQPLYGAVKVTPALEVSAVEQKIEDAAAQPEPTAEELSAEDYVHRGYQKAEADDFDAAIADFDEAIRLNPEFAPAYYRRGYTLRLQKKFDEAIAAFNEAIRLDPRYLEAYGDRGLARRWSGDTEGAIRDFDEVLRLDSRDYLAYHHRGIARRSLDDRNGAIADFNEAIRLNGRYAPAYRERGLALQEKGDLKGAIADFSEAIALKPEHASYHYFRGDARRAAGDFEGAVADYDEAIRLDPNDADTYNERGNASLKQGDFERAAADFSEAIRLDGQVGIFFSNRGEANFGLGQYERALEDFRQANSLLPADSYALAGLAITQHALGEQAEAKRLWRMLIGQDKRARDAAWMGKALSWHPILVEAARKLISEL